MVLVSTHWHARSHIDAESDTIVCTLPPTLHATERLMPMVRSCGGVGIASTMISCRLWAANLKHDTLLPGRKPSSICSLIFFATFDSLTCVVYVLTHSSHAPCTSQSIGCGLVTEQLKHYNFTANCKVASSSPTML